MTYEHPFPPPAQKPDPMIVAAYAVCALAGGIVGIALGAIGTLLTLGILP